MPIRQFVRMVYPTPEQTSVNEPGVGKRVWLPVQTRVDRFGFVEKTCKNTNDDLQILYVV